MVIEEGPRGRRTYAITDAGREELRRWMRHPPDAYVVRNEFVLRLFLLSALDPAEARAALRQLAAENDTVLAALRDTLYGLYAILRLHTVQEDEAYLSLGEDAGTVLPAVTQGGTP